MLGARGSQNFVPIKSVHPSIPSVHLFEGAERSEVLPAWGLPRPAFSEQTGKAKKTPSSDPYASWQRFVMRLREGVGVT
jgi:hypothetical protein